MDTLIKLVDQLISYSRVKDSTDPDLFEAGHQMGESFMTAHLKALKELAEEEKKKQQELGKFFSA